MVTPDITCDLMDVDETDLGLTLPERSACARPDRARALVLAGDTDASAVAEVVDFVDKPAGKVVHLRLLPGHIEAYAALVHRVLTDQ